MLQQYTRISVLTFFFCFHCRQYVLASRQKDIFHCWPFPKKYLQICLKHGIKNVLPPLEPHHLAIQSLRGSRCSNSSQQNKENAGGSSQRVHQIIEEQDQFLNDESKFKSDETISKIWSPDFHLSHSCNSDKHEGVDPHLGSDVASDSIISRDQPSANIPSSLFHVDDPCNKTMSLTKRLRLKRKRHKGKGKHKKKSMVDILTVAKPCTEEDLCRINRLYDSYGKQPLEHSIEGGKQITTVEHSIEGGKQITTVERSSESELTEEGFNDKLLADDFDGADINMVGRNRLVVKFKFSSCSSTS